MLPLHKTTTGIALLLTLSACGSRPTKEKITPLQTRNFGVPSVTSDSLRIRTEADYQFVLGDVLSGEGNSAKAAEHFEKVAKLDPAPAVYLRLSAEYKNLNMMKEAILNAEKAIDKDPKNIEAHFTLAKLYTSDEAYDQAISQYHAILRLQPLNKEAPIYIGSLYTTKKDFKTAERYFTSVLKNPNYDTPYMVHYYLGLMHLEQKGSASELAAENELKKSLKLSPRFEDALISLADLYLRQNHRNKALALCLEFEKKEGFSTKVADLIAQIHIDGGNLDKAYDQFNQITSTSDSSPEMEMKMALILIKNKRYALAISKLNDILVKFPNADSARYYLAAVYEESGDPENAIRNYTLVPQSSDHFNESIAHAAFLLKDQGKLREALALIEKGLKTDPDSQVYIMHASLLDTKSDYLGAVRTLEEGLTKYSRNTEMLFQHAIMLDRLGKKAAMTVQMKKVLEIDPDHIQSLSYLAFSLAELNQTLPEAEKMARHASELAPKDGFVLDTLGWVLFKQKKFSESIKVLEKAYQYQPSASIIAEHLADAYAMQLETEKAKEMYKRAASLTTDEMRANKSRDNTKTR